MPIIFSKGGNFILKKILITLLLGLSILPLMAFDVVEDNEIIFTYEIIEEEVDITQITEWDYYFTWENVTSQFQYDYFIGIMDNGKNADVYISSNYSKDSIFYTNDILSQNIEGEGKYSKKTVLDNTDGLIETATHLRISDYGQNNLMLATYHPLTSENYSDLFFENTLKLNEIDPTIDEGITGVIGSIASGFTGLFALLFSSDGIINVFYTPATETVSGSLTIIGVLSLLTFGFGIVVFAFRKILKLLKMRS